MAVGTFFITLQRSTIGLCMEGMIQPLFFWSKYPEKVAPIWNLINLFPGDAWLFTFSSLALVTLFFTLSAKLYGKLGLKKRLQSLEIVLVPFTVKVMKPSKTKDNFSFGFSSSLVFLTWSVWAGFLLHMLLSNYLAVLLKPNYDQPLRNAADVVASNKDIFYTPRAAYIKSLFATSSDPDYAELGKNNNCQAKVKVKSSLSVRSLILLNPPYRHKLLNHF